MAVPTSGILTLLGLAQEALYGTYGSGTITSPIHLYDLVNGGDSAGSGNSYPTVNTCCTPNPADRGTYNSFTLYPFNVSGTVTLYTTVALTALTTGTIIYDSVSGSIYTGGGGFMAGPSGTVWFGQNTCSCPAISTNTSTGAVTGTSCDCP